MQVTVLGASGKVGRLVVVEALRRGYSVVGLVHSHNHLDAGEQLTIIKGDVQDKVVIAKAVQGSQVVLSCLGSWKSSGHDVVSSAMRVIIPIMKEQGIMRVVTLTGSGALTPDKSPSSLHRLLLKLLSPIVIGKVFYDGEEHMRLLAASNLDWTTVRSPVMKSMNTNTYKLSLKPSLPWEVVSRQAVAHAMLDQIEAVNFMKQAPIIHNSKQVSS